MLDLASTILGLTAEARDGAVGNVRDLLFEYPGGTIRWMVLAASGWIAKRQLLIPAGDLQPPDRQSEALPLDLLREDVSRARSLRDDPPAASTERPHEQVDAFGHETYTLPADFPPPKETADSQGEGAAGAGEARPAATRQDLRSVQELMGYRVEADQPAGKVEDVVLDVETWLVRYLLVGTRLLLPGRRILLPLPLVRQIDAAGRRVYVEPKLEQLKSAPAYDPDANWGTLEQDVQRHFAVQPEDRGAGEK